MSGLLPEAMRPKTLFRDLVAALAVTCLAVPQGIAYALIAGLPPIVGLYAATVPTIVGSLFRSSRHVIAGPTNAVSLLVGGSVAALSVQLGLSPAQVAVQLALVVGLMQVGAGVLRLGALVDYISQPVVLGYITGAGVLIGVGQLPNLTGTPGVSGILPSQLLAWGAGLGEATWLPLAVGLGVAGLVVTLRTIDGRIPAAILALAAATVVSVVFDLPAMGLKQLGDLSAVPVGAPPFALPGAPSMALLSLGLATMVLSLVEATAVGRSLADQTGDPLDATREFVGQGLANLSAAFFGGYPVGGSLSRSKLNHQAGAKTRMAGVFAGLLTLLVLMVAGPVAEKTPIASLAGLLLVVAWDLVDRKRIVMAMNSAVADKAAFVTTVVGTWVLPLDKAIYLGVAISIVLFVRRASSLVVRGLQVDASGHLREVPASPASRSAISVLQVEGPLFFGAAPVLRDALEAAGREERVCAVVVRLKRTQGLDMTCLDVLARAASLFRERGKVLILADLPETATIRLADTGIAEIIGRENLFPTGDGGFVALDQALSRAIAASGEHADTGELRRYLERRCGGGGSPSETSEPS